MAGQPGRSQRWLTIAIEKFIGQLASAVLVGEFDGDGADPFRVDNGYKAIREYAFDGCAAS